MISQAIKALRNPVRNLFLYSSRCLLQRRLASKKTITCTLIPGDGVGPELCQSVKSVFKHCGVPVKFEEIYLSELNPSLCAPLEKAYESIKKNKVALKGPHETPLFSSMGELQSLGVTIRKDLDLFANVVPIKTIPGIKTRHSNLDYVVIREQTEGEYSALEHQCVKGIVECLKIVTRDKSRRIAKFAFDYAVKHGRKKVTAVHKANIMKVGDGLFLNSCAEVAQDYPKIEFNSMIVDNTCMQLVKYPQQFDVMVLPNLYGTIIDNVSAGLVGGAGVVPGCSYSSEVALFEPGARHCFIAEVGKNTANPTAMLLCASNMLAHLNLDKYAKCITQGVQQVILEGKVRTRDLGGYSGSSDFTVATIEAIQNLMSKEK